jgi:1-deoxy-D-xylulose-5-phosphate synthase
MALGTAIGSRLRGEDGRSIAVIGDGSIVTGMAFEALNHAGELKQDLTVVLNDNEMSIAPSSGAMAGHLNRIITGRTYNRMRADVWNLFGLMPLDMSDRARQAAKKIEEGMKNLVVPSMVFEELGFRYVGPVDGHSLPELIRTFKRLKFMHGPVLVHVATRKGRGYEPALKNPELFHGIGPFDCTTGKRTGGNGRSFAQAFGESMLDLAGRDDRVVAITAGMCLGTGLQGFRERFPNRLFDVGICEQHAVTFAAGLAMAGLRPVVALYSTFLQRALDQVIEDVCLQKLPVIFAVDRAGFVGEDGPTHHGVFDLTYLGMMPGMTVMAPKDEAELADMLEFARKHESGPVAVRYPRGSSGACSPQVRRPIELGRSETLREGTDGCVVAIGSMVWPVMQATEQLASGGPDLTVVNARFVKPLDEDRILELANRYRTIATAEENVLNGGFGSAVVGLLEQRGMDVRVRRLGISDHFVQHASRSRLLEQEGLAGAALVNRLRTIFG